MSVSSKRLDRVVEALSPEAKARWLIEGPLLGHDVNRAEEQHVLDSLSPEDGLRYNAYLARWDCLRDNLRSLISICGAVKSMLLERDRLLWYRRGLMDVAEAIVFGDAAKPLLVGNRNMKPGRPVVVRAGLGTVRLGVWGRRRLPVSDEPQAELNPKLLEALDSLVAQARAQAAECKAVAAYVLEETKAMELQTVGPVAEQAVREIAQYDRPLLREIVEGKATGPPPGAVFPVEERWTLDWEAIEPDSETTQRVRKDPNGWVPRWVEETLTGRSQGQGVFPPDEELVADPAAGDEALLDELLGPPPSPPA